MLSIVIPTKNEEEYLPILLETIWRQTLQPAEIIVADAGSSDRTREVARASGCRVVEGGMPGPGRNRGAETAISPYILFLDADVQLLDPSFLERAMEEIRERNLDFATCDVVPLSPRPIDRVFHRFYNRYSRLCQPIHAHAPGFCIFARKSLHDRVGGFDESVVFCEDHDYAERCCKVGSFAFLDSTKVHVSIRRFDRDGRMNIAVKYALSELHLVTLGPIRHDGFKYEFGYKKKASIPDADRERLA
ncbi:glycosyltransferase [Candidatus Uhrbacteria bacterium]|nr:glycosyltransferase [Candidatus Uhrbacteria bacterium]